MLASATTVRTIALRPRASLRRGGRRIRPAEFLRRSSARQASRSGLGASDEKHDQLRIVRETHGRIRREQACAAVALMEERLAAFLSRPFLFQRPIVEETRLYRVWPAGSGRVRNLVFSRRSRRDGQSSVGRNRARALVSMRAGVAEQLGSEVAD